MILIGFVLAGLSLRTHHLFTPLFTQSLFLTNAGRKYFNKSLCASDKCAVWLIRCPLYPRKRTFLSAM